MPTYTPISSSLITAWKANAQNLWTLIKDNFGAHQSRLNTLEVPPALASTASIYFYGSATVPSGYLACTGQAVSRTTYAALFTAIGTTFGAGDGSTTFNVPNLQGRIPMGAGQGSGLTDRALGVAVGTENHALTTAEMPSHTHGLSPSNPTHRHLNINSLSGGSGTFHFHTGFNSGGSGTSTALQTNTSQVNLTIGNTGSGSAHNNTQPSLVVNYIIKT